MREEKMLDIAIVHRGEPLHLGLQGPSVVLRSHLHLRTALDPPAQIRFLADIEAYGRRYWFGMALDGVPFFGGRGVVALGWRRGPAADEDEGVGVVGTGGGEEVDFAGAGGLGEEDGLFGDGDDGGFGCDGGFLPGW